jgi:acyl-CoA hydrolase
MTKHVRSAQTEQSSKPTSYARVTLARIMTAVDVNLLDTVHGGVMMKFIDDAAGACATRHCGHPAVTAAIDEIAFLAPVRVGDLMHAHAQVTP